MNVIFVWKIYKGRNDLNPDYFLANLCLCKSISPSYSITVLKLSFNKVQKVSFLIH